MPKKGANQRKQRIHQDFCDARPSLLWCYAQVLWITPGEPHKLPAYEMQPKINPHMTVAEHFAALKKVHPEWMVQYDNTDFSSTPQSDLTALLASAPNAFAIGIVYGKMAILASMATMTSAAAVAPIRVKPELPSFARRQIAQDFEPSDHAPLAAILS